MAQAEALAALGYAYVPGPSGAPSDFVRCPSTTNYPIRSSLLTVPVYVVVDFATYVRRTTAIQS